MPNEMSEDNKMFDSSFMDKVLQPDHSLTRSSIKRSPRKIVIHMDQSKQLQESLQRSQDFSKLSGHVSN